MQITRVLPTCSWRLGVAMSKRGPPSPAGVIRDGWQHLGLDSERAKHRDRVGYTHAGEQQHSSSALPWPGARMLASFTLDRHRRSASLSLARRYVSLPRDVPRSGRGPLRPVCAQHKPYF